MTTLTLTINRADWIETSDGRTGVVVEVLDEAEVFVAFDGRPAGLAELVSAAQIARVIPAE